MARYKPYKYNQMVMVPILFQHQLEPGTLEHTINELVNTTLIFRSSKRVTGTTTAAPERSIPNCY